MRSRTRGSLITRTDHGWRGGVRRGDCSGLKRGALVVGWGWKGAAQGADWDIELAPGLLRFTRSGSCQRVLSSSGSSLIRQVGPGGRVSQAVEGISMADCSCYL